jgi:ribosomal protein S18 acetylase RimI-like enzyme
MTADVLIRPATRDDLGAVRSLLVETWHDTYDPLLGRERVTEITNRWHAVEALARQLDAPDSSFLVAERDREAIAHAHAQARDPRILVLGRLYVRPAFQRQGIGGRLLAAVTLRHLQASLIRLTVEADNAKGVAFYRRNGFAVTGEVVENGLRGLRMEKALAGGVAVDQARGPPLRGVAAPDILPREGG